MGPLQTDASVVSDKIPSPTVSANVAAHPDSPRRVMQLDFVRGVAILMVMQFHSAKLPTDNAIVRVMEDFFAKVGWAGVDLFFVLSGFLVGGLLVQELNRTGDLRIKRFLLRRMFKIWPAYYCYLLFQIVLRRHPLSTFIWQNSLNIQNYTGTSLNHTWSLAVEEHFYLLLPVLLLTVYNSRRLRRATIPILGSICLAVLCLRIWAVYGLHLPGTQWQTQYRLDGLLFGVILSYLLYEHRPQFEWLLRQRLALVGVFAAGLLFCLRFDATPLMFSIGFTTNYLALGALLLLIYGYRGWLLRTWVYRAVAWIGVYSYGIYLWHESVHHPLMNFAARLPGILRPIILGVSQHAAAIVLGVLMTKAIEFPMLRLRDRIVPRGAGQPPPQQA